MIDTKRIKILRDKVIKKIPLKAMKEIIQLIIYVALL